MTKTLSLCFFTAFINIVSIHGGTLNRNGDLSDPFDNISFKEAILKAKDKDKLVFIDCYTSWCGPCRKMSNTVFKDEFVIKFLKQEFLSLKINTEKDEDGPMIIQKYNVKVYPTYLILDTNGSEIGRFTGGCSSKDFVEKIKKYIRK